MTAAIGDPQANLRYTIVGADGSFSGAGGPDAARCQPGPDAFLWADAVDPTSEQMERLQREFDLHPLAVDDACDEHQRGKVEAYDNSWFIIAHALLAAGAGVGTTEVVIFAGDRFVVTVRRTPAFAFDEITRRWGTLRGLRRGPGAFVYTILDSIVDGYLPFVTDCEARLEAIEQRLLEQNKRQSRGTKILADIIAIKYSLQVIRHAVGPMQDVVERIARGDVRFFQDDEMVFYRNVGTHVKRVLARVDALNDMVTTALTLNVSIASNRQADIARQLTVIATIFLPLTFITGFFGQNFGYLVNHITGPGDFLIWGLGSEVAAVALLFYFFFRRRWL